MALSPKLGLIVSGLTGVGKSTLQAALLREGCWTPRVVTSRPVETDEGSTIAHAPRLHLISNLHAGSLVAPIIFGANVYAWATSDFERLRRDPVGAVLATRPYTALLLAATIPKLVPIWLDLPEDVRRQRLTMRASARDTDKLLAAQRLARDADDEPYREFFSLKILAGRSALTCLAQISEGKLSSTPPPDNSG